MTDPYEVCIFTRRCRELSSGVTIGLVLGGMVVGGHGQFFGSLKTRGMT